MTEAYYKRSFLFNSLEKLTYHNYTGILNGYARIITFSVDGPNPQANFKKNKFESMYEGEIKNGIPHGLGRMFFCN